MTDARTASALTPAEVAQKLSKASLLFLGESHTSAEFHRVQLQVIRELHRAGRKVLVGLEMFPVAEQPALDLWNGGTLSETEFVEKSRWYRNWGYHWNYYRDIFLFCRDAKIPLYGVNVPRELVSDVRKKGFDGLTAEQKALLPPKIDSENADHRRLFKAFFEESDSMHSASMPEAMWDGMFRAQCTWDAAMAWNAVAPLKKPNDPNAVMVVLIGAGPRRLRPRRQRQAALWFDGAAASVIPIPVLDEKDRPAKVRASYADFVWGVAKETDPAYPVLGFSTRDPKDGSEGWPVINVDQDSVAEAAGFKVGDVLLAMDGNAAQGEGDVQPPHGRQALVRHGLLRGEAGRGEGDARRDARPEAAGAAEGRRREEVTAGGARPPPRQRSLAAAFLGAASRRGRPLAPGARAAGFAALPARGRRDRLRPRRLARPRDRASSASRPASPSPPGRRPEFLLNGALKVVKAVPPSRRSRSATWRRSSGTTLRSRSRSAARLR